MVQQIHTSIEVCKSRTPTDVCSSKSSFNTYNKSTCIGSAYQKHGEMKDESKTIFNNSNTRTIFALVIHLKWFKLTYERVCRKILTPVRLRPAFQPQFGATTPSR